MTRSTFLRTLSVVSLSAAALGLSLTGCTAIEDAVNEETRLSFSSKAALDNEWELKAPWVPGDASDISTRATNDGSVAVLMATSESELDPDVCTEVERQSGPTFNLEGSPDPYAAATVFACDDWAVIPFDDGWFGWTPNHPEEQEQSPAS